MKIIIADRIVLGNRGIAFIIFILFIIFLLNSCGFYDKYYIEPIKDQIEMYDSLLQSGKIKIKIK